MSILLGSCAIIVLIFAPYISRRLTGAALTPMTAMTMPWATCVLCLQLPLLDYTGNVNKSVPIFAAAVVSFCAGCVLAWVVYFRSFSRIVPRRAANNEIAVAILAARLTLFAGFIGAVSYYWQFNRAFGIGLLFSSASEVRHIESFGVARETIGNPLNALMVFIVPGIALCISTSFFCRGRLRIVQTTFGIIGLGLLMLNSGRTALFSGIVVTSVAMYNSFLIYGVEKKVIRRLIVLGTTICVAFVGYFNSTNLRLSKSLAESEYIVVGPQISEHLLWAVGPYHYLVGPLVAFGELTDKEISNSDNGNLTFGAVARVAHELWPSHFKYPSYVQSFVYTPIPTNVYTYLDAFLYDFGWPGVFLMPMFWGAVTTIVFCQMIVRRSFYLVLVSAVFTYCCFSSIGINRFGTLEVWLWISGSGAFYLICRVFRAKVT